MRKWLGAFAFSMLVVSCGDSDDVTRVATVANTTTTTPTTVPVTTTSAAVGTGLARPRPPARGANRTGAAPVGAHSAGASGVEAAILAAFGPYGPAALRVADCESDFDPHATNGNHRGLLQINVVVHAKRIANMGYTPDQMWEVGPHLHVARAIFDEGKDWHQWSCKP
jgi:hypothetical protein